MGLGGREHLRHCVSDSRLLGRDPCQVSPLRVLSVHIDVNRPVGQVRMEVRQLDSRKPVFDKR